LGETLRSKAAGMKTVYLSLGSNLGDRATLLSEALRMIESPRLHVRRVSPIYETEPQDVKTQPWFLNLVAEVETDLFPRQLLSRLKGFERRLGRRRRVSKGPREIDIDILLFGDAVIDTQELTVPHPRMPERRFVLQPLADLAPELRHPLLKKTVREMLATTMQQAVRRHSQP